jgi:hypothetical protein
LRDVERLKGLQSPARPRSPKLSEREAHASMKPLIRKQRSIDRGTQAGLSSAPASATSARPAQAAVTGDRRSGPDPLRGDGTRRTNPRGGRPARVARPKPCAEVNGPNRGNWLRTFLAVGGRPLPTPGQSAKGDACAPVAQLDRALPSEGKGHTFESCRVRHSTISLPVSTQGQQRAAGSSSAITSGIRCWPSGSVAGEGTAKVGLYQYLIRGCLTYVS